jgi:hypothetical protein
MIIQNILSEGDLREWLRDYAKSCSVSLQWVEPTLRGSTIGAPDVIMKADGVEIPIELKVLVRMRKGIKFTVRPAQRRWHHMGMKKGNKSALLFIEMSSNNKLWLVRGDKIPLRDYAAHPDSGCENGICSMWHITQSDWALADKRGMSELKDLLFNNEPFWR